MLSVAVAPDAVKRLPEGLDSCARHHESTELFNRPTLATELRGVMTDAYMDATATAELIRSGAVSPAELIDETIARIEKLNPALNAITIELFDKARAEASAADGPFRGVPYVLKDLTIVSKGDPYTASIAGVKAAGYRADHDSWFVERMRAAGFVLVGRANTPEMGIMSTTEPLAWGPTRNPWDPERSVGGSSGGSAAAVASGMVPVAHGNDGGGSVRMPASLNGVVGLKPSRGRISTGPAVNVSDLLAGDAHEGLLTRSVRDVAAVLDIVGGHRPGDGYAAPTPVESFAAALRSEPPRLRIGVLDHDPVGELEVAAESITAVRRAADVLADLGHEVADGHPPALSERLDGGWPTEFMRCIAVAIMRELDHFGELIGRPLGEDDMEAQTWVVYQAGKGVSGAQYAEGIDCFRARARDVETWWDEGWDLLLTPTTMVGAPPHLGRPDASPEAMEWRSRRFGGGSENEPDPFRERFVGLMEYLVPYNVTGQPALTVPTHHSNRGFPVGVHAVGAYGRDDLVLQVGAQLERALPWHDRRPPFGA
jgi:amidase